MAFLGTALLAAGWPVILQILRLLFSFFADLRPVEESRPRDSGLRTAVTFVSRGVLACQWYFALIRTFWVRR